MSKILVIDDERSIRNTLKDILEYEKYEVDLAEDGNKGIEKVKNAEYDIILCDIKMPGLDGIEVLEHLNKIAPDTPVVMISGHGNIDTAVDSIIRDNPELTDVQAEEKLVKILEAKAMESGKKIFSLIEEAKDGEQSNIQNEPRPTGSKEQERD